VIPSPDGKPFTTAYLYPIPQQCGVVGHCTEHGHHPIAEVRDHAVTDQHHVVPSTHERSNASGNVTVAELIASPSAPGWAAEGSFP
jgi:hypothetical protein